MSEAFLVDALRTPRGKAKPGGGLNWASPRELAAAVARELARRTGLPVDGADDLVLGCATQSGEQGGDLARAVALEAGLGDAVAGLTVNRFCASGLEAIAIAAARARTGAADVVVAGGVESVSRVPMYGDGGEHWAAPAVLDGAFTVPMGVAADLVATVEGFERDELDVYGARTHQRAEASWAAGLHHRSLVCPTPPDGDTLEVDEQLRPGTTLELVAAQAPAFAAAGAAGPDAVLLARFPDLDAIDHRHTRSTSPTLADAAALALVVSEDGLTGLGAQPRARVVASATAGADPFVMLTAGQVAAEKALDRAGLTAADLDLVEFAEAFAALCLRFQRDLDVDDDRFNVNGGMIATGHAFGATGAILVSALLDELDRREARYGLVAVSGAAGLGSAMVVERLP